MARNGNSTFEAPCSFGNLSVGLSINSIRVSIPDSKIPVDQAEKFFKGSQLDLTITCDPAVKKGDDPEQMTLGDDVITIEEVVDVAQYQRSRVATSFTIALPMHDDESDDDYQARLNKLAKRQGKISVVRTGDMPEKKVGRPPKGEGEDEE